METLSREKDECEDRSKAAAEAMTLRCDKDSRRRIEAAWKKEKGRRPDLALGRFLAERVADGMAGNGNSTGSIFQQNSTVDLEEVAQVVSISSAHATAEAIGTEVVPILDRLAGIERMLGAMAHVLHEIALQVSSNRKT